MSGIKFETKWLAPLGVLCAFLALWSFMFFPMLNGTPKNVPYAALSLDEGATNMGATVNVGDQLVSKLTDPDAAATLSTTGISSSDEDSETPIKWTVLNSQQELDEAMNGNDYYGAIVIPKDFTAKQLAAKQAETQATLKQNQAQQQAQAELQQQLAQAKAQGASDEQIQQMQADAVKKIQETQTETQTETQAEIQSTQSDQSDSDADKPTIEIITNGAKNASVAQQLSTQMSNTLEQLGVNVKSTTVHSYDLGTTTGAQMIGQLSAAPTIAMSASCIMIMFSMTHAGKNASRKERFARLGIQLGYALVLSAGVAGLACFLMGVIGGMTAPFATVFLFLWMASFCIMSMLIGLMTLCFPIGAIGMFALMGTMSCAYTAPEMLPTFFHDWIYPWSPARYVVDGVRSVIFLGDNTFNASLGALSICLIIGLVAAAIGLALPAARSKTDTVANAATA